MVATKSGPKRMLRFMLSTWYNIISYVKPTSVGVIEFKFESILIHVLLLLAYRWFRHEPMNFDLVCWL
jgi:hypothetical protein